MNWNDGAKVGRGEDQCEGQERLRILRAKGPMGHN